MLELNINWSWTCYKYNYQADLLLHFKIKTLNVLFAWDIFWLIEILSFNIQTVAIHIYLLLALFPQKNQRTTLIQ